MSPEIQAIPDDIRRTASTLAGDLRHHIAVADIELIKRDPVMEAMIVKVLHAERKRSAAVAKDATMATGAPLEQMGDEVAAAILQQPETQKFWMVYGIGTRGPTYRHFSKAAAQTEAQRLAALHPETMFVVLAAVDAYATEKPAMVRFKLFKTAPLGRDADDDIPF